jgi:hypothetical protein
MMTTALRDSLGGNCRTVMVATVSAAAEQADESISTCRFAQRVAMISNEVPPLLLCAVHACKHLSVAFAHLSMLGGAGDCQ